MNQLFRSTWGDDGRSQVGLPAALGCPTHEASADESENRMQKVEASRWHPLEPSFDSFISKSKKAELPETESHASSLARPASVLLLHHPRGRFGGLLIVEQYVDVERYIPDKLNEGDGLLEGALVWRYLKGKARLSKQLLWVTQHAWYWPEITCVHGLVGYWSSTEY